MVPGEAMLDVRERRERRHSLLNTYCSQLGRIVERNRAEAALLAAKQEAERSAEMARAALVEAQAADRAKTEFLANMSHELRTPLNAIIGFSDMMQNGLVGADDDSKYKEYARDIHDSGQHLLEVINDILDLAKIEAGELQLHEQVVSVHRIAHSCLTIIKERAHESGLTLTHDLPEDLPAVNADERKFKQILINLLSNAVKFTPEGGRIELKAETDDAGRLAVSVIDSGIGMDEQDIPKALAPFWQVDSDLSRKYEGTGLGLPLTKALVELHGGTLTIASEVDVGTTVTVLLPASRVRKRSAALGKQSAVG